MKTKEIPTFDTASLDAAKLERWKTIGLISNRMHNKYMDILESELNEF